MEFVWAGRETTRRFVRKLILGRQYIVITFEGARSSGGREWTEWSA